MPQKKKKFAYARVIDKIRLPEEYHLGKKLLAQQKEEIRQLYAEGGWTYRSLADEFDVSYSTVQQTINPQAYEQAQEAGKRYRERTIHKKNKDSMELRKRKKQLIQKGLIKII